MSTKVSFLPLFSSEYCPWLFVLRRMHSFAGGEQLESARGLDGLIARYSEPLHVSSQISPQQKKARLAALIVKAWLAGLKQLWWHPLLFILFI